MLGYYFLGQVMLGYLSSLVINDNK